MPLVPAICTQCGSPIEVDNAKEAGICPHCGTAFITEKVVNNYVTNHVSNTTVTQSITKVIHGREKTEAEEYVARGLSFLGLEEYIKAAECFEKAVKSEPGNIEHHILLYRALTFDFRLYYGGLTDPARQGYEINFLLNEQNEEKTTSLNEVFARIDKLAQKTDISALQKQYGYTFRKDKNFWLQSYRTAAKAYIAGIDGTPSEVALLLGKALGLKPSAFNTHGEFRRFDLCAAYAVENLYACPDFTEEERAAFFEEYRRDFTDLRLREMQAEAMAKAAYYGRHEDYPDGPKGVLTVLTYKIFPLRDGYYDLTGYRGAVVYANAWPNDNALPDLRLSAENIRSCPLQAGTHNLRAKNCILAGEGNIDVTECLVMCENLYIENGITEIVKQDKQPGHLAFQSGPAGDRVTLRFGKGLKRIGQDVFAGITYGQKNFPCFYDPVLFPEGLEYIGGSAFTNCRFDIAVMPETLKEVGKLPFGETSVNLVCLCNTSQWPADWSRYKQLVKLLYSSEWVEHGYNYLDIPNNTWHIDYDPDPEKTEEYRKTLLRFKPYAAFDENKTRFVGPAEKPAEEKKQGCYIATAVYGSYDCPQVWTLRRYRDHSLARSAPGRLFIRVYYALSPTLVKLFGKQRWFCAFWKRILDKKVCRLNRKGIDDSPYRD